MIAPEIMSLTFIDLTADDDPISLRHALTPKTTLTEASQPKKETLPSAVPNLQKYESIERQITSMLNILDPGNSKRASFFIYGTAPFC